MSDQHRFRNDRPKATGRRESDQSNEHMDEKNEDIAHTPNANRASEGAGIHADLVIRHQQLLRGVFPCAWGIRNHGAVGV